MAKIAPADLSGLLNEIAQALDIPDSLYEIAVSRYKAVGTWLGEGSSPLAAFSPQIYPQGSFELGTVTRPLAETDHFDIDSVFELVLSKYKVSQHTLKDMVGDRLKANEMYQKMLDDEGDRCWTLNYADGDQFHLDILPAVSDYDTHVFLEAQGVPANFASTSIAITDKTSPNYDLIDPEWPRCNPKAYAAWFRQQMIVQFDVLRKQFAEAKKAQIDRVPDYLIKTPLQRCVQLMKRHRDVRFVNTPEIQPASIILTTLAAYAYHNEADLLVALANILDQMPNYISDRDGITWVENPVDPSENFADRWKRNPKREPAFRAWLNQFRTDMSSLINCGDINEVNKLLVQMFGEKVSNAVVNRYKEKTVSGNSLGVVTPTRPVLVIRDPMKPWG